MVNDKFQELFNRYQHHKSKENGQNPNQLIDTPILEQFRQRCKNYDQTQWPSVVWPPTHNIEHFASERLQMERRCKEIELAREREAKDRRAKAKTAKKNAETNALKRRQKEFKSDAVLLAFKARYPKPKIVTKMPK